MAGLTLVATAYIGALSSAGAILAQDGDKSMTVTRVNEFEAQAGRGAELFGFLEKSMTPVIKMADGYHSHQILQNIDEPEKIVVIEVWTSVESHQASAKSIPAEVIQQIMPILAGPPTGAYYRP